MDIQIQSVHFDATEKLQDFIEKKITKLGKFSDEITSVDFILKVFKPETNTNKEASVTVNVKHDELFASKIGETFEEAIDQCAEALEKQLTKYKEKAQAK
ncbi:MAG: ribosome-associated translation inhibitor RaiA [Bacteroidota bacterium]